MLSRTPTLAELLNYLKDRASADIRVALPGRIEKFDATSKLADVQPLISDRIEVENGTTTLQLPVIPNVPVIFPGSGPYRIQFPVKQGDEVLLVFSDRSLDAWQDQGGITDPDDQRRHHLTDAIAILGVTSNKNKTSDDIDLDVITIGKDGESADWVALATKTKNEIGALRDNQNALVSAFNSLQTLLASHKHAFVGSGTVNASVELTVPPLESADGPAVVGDVNSSTVKVKG